MSDKGADEAESAFDGGSGVGAGSGAAGDFAADSGEGGASSPVPAPQAPKMSSYAYTVAPTAIADGEPLFFDQEPPLISANYSGPVTLRHFNVAGDYATVQFRRYDPSDAAGRIETWTRVNSRSVDGRVVSVFEPISDQGGVSADQIGRQRKNCCRS